MTTVRNILKMRGDNVAQILTRSPTEVDFYFDFYTVIKEHLC